MAYTAWSVVFGEQPSAAKWNILGTNDASFADGTGFDADAIKSSKLFYGLVRNRQGGAAGDASWYTTGTTNVATDAKDVFIQVGSTATSSGSDTSITFPTAFTYAPVVICNTSQANAANSFTVAKSITTTGFTAVTLNTGGARTAEAVNWIAIGQ